MGYWNMNIPDPDRDGRIDELIKFVGILQCNKNNMVEIGTWKGTSATAFSLVFDQVCTLDVPHLPDGGPTGVLKHLETLNLKNVKGIVRTDSTYKLFDNESLDMVYIDGDHTTEGVLQDLKEFVPKIKPGGYITGHDYDNWDPPEAVRKAVDEFFGKPPEILEKSCSSAGDNWAYRI